MGRKDTCTTCGNSLAAHAEVGTFTHAATTGPVGVEAEVAVGVSVEGDDDEAEEGPYDDMSYNELRAEARSRGIAATGGADAIVERLLTFDNEE